ncbi:uncharacterized protein LOC141866609 [Acropora palmata]|uniref:uncharacterized protein LOC141866609 n=1 Tax=Acropora palmata TaxID=6131 RepID=UPI003D9FC839
MTKHSKTTSCKQLQLQAKKPKNSTVYTLYDPASKSFYQTFCDLTSENGFVWTLLESFSLADNNDFNNQPFSKDHPVNQNSFTWNKFRLSRLLMNSTPSHSTFFRATCNFNIDGLVTTDYLRAKTTDLNILLLNGETCVKMEYINIRGYDCYNCTAKMIQTINWHLHTSTHYVEPCQFTSARNDSVASQGGEDNFGFYQSINPLHRCTSGDNATTQWWFGENQGNRSKLSGKMRESLWTNHDCYNWTAWIFQTSNWHLHTDSYHGIHCQFTNARNGSVASSGGENNFGCYHTINPLHRCTSGDNAATQWWFGEQ